MIKKTNSPRKIGLLGTGYIADWHAGALRAVPGVSLVAVCDRDERRAGAFAVRHGIKRVSNSLEAMLSEGQVDAIHVLLPPDLHARAAGAIIDAGIDVLLEKPMAITADECDQLVARARSAGAKVGVGHNFLFAPVYERLKDDVTAGRLGRIDEVTITWNKGLGQVQSGPFNLWMLREPGNIMLEVGSHSVAHMLDLVGAVKVMGVRASNSTELPGGARFFRSWRVDAETGAMRVALNFSFTPGFSQHLIQIRGSLGAATVDFERNTYLLHRHTPTGMDFDRYFMTVSDAKDLKGQARGTLVRTIYSKFRPIGAGPYGQSIARTMLSFYGDTQDSIDRRLSLEFGREVVRTCEQIARQVTDTRTRLSAPVADEKGVQANGTARAPASSRAEVLVLGATGFIGQELARQLVEAGHPTRLLVRDPARLSADLKSPRVDVVVGDLSQESDLAGALEGIRCVYHLARPNVKTWEEWAVHEVESTRRVAEACLKAQVGRLIYTGTIDSYYLGAKAGTITEATPLDPWVSRRNYYARAKALSEQSLMELHRERGLPVVILRPGIVIGRGGNPMHWGIGMWSHDSVCQIWGQGRTPLPLVLGEDVASALVAALALPGIEGQSFNLCAESGLSACDYLAAFEGCLGVEFQKIPTSIWKFYLVDVAKWLVKTAVRHPDRRRPSYRDWESRTQGGHFDSSKARRVLGWCPTETRDDMIRKGIDEPARALFDLSPKSGVGSAREAGD
jgi:predicted dehydrogenase/nucleoside-diphosphate-sugar epimerase